MEQESDRLLASAAAGALVKIGRPAVPYLREASKHPRKEVRQLAENALRYIPAEQAPRD